MQYRYQKGTHRRPFTETLKPRIVRAVGFGLRIQFRVVREPSTLHPIHPKP